MTETYFEPPNITTREPSLEDLKTLESILRLTVIDADTKDPIEDEIASVLARVTSSLGSEPTAYRYLVAEDMDGTVIGMMGVTQPDEEMRGFAEHPDSCIELINAYIRPKEPELDEAGQPIKKGRGAGSILVADLLSQAITNGATEVVVNSGPRYKETGWPFWTKMFGEAKALKDRYGEGLDAMVWRQPIL